MAELDLRWFDNPEDEGQLKQLVDSIDVLDANILSSKDVRQLLDVFERFPDDDGFESFWGIVHLLERTGGYESALVNSVRRSFLEGFRFLNGRCHENFVYCAFV